VSHPIQNSLKGGDALLLLIFNFTLEYNTAKVKENHKKLELNSTHQLLVYATDVNLLGNTNMLKIKSTESLLATSKEDDHQKGGQNHNIKIAIKMW
jgi:hypothetical protein